MQEAGPQDTGLRKQPGLGTGAMAGVTELAKVKVVGISNDVGGTYAQGVQVPLRMGLNHLLIRLPHRDLILRHPQPKADSIH